MLNILEEDITLEEEKFKAFSEVSNPYKMRTFAMWLLALITLVVLIMFLPWTQNIQVKGKVTSLHPSERPQTIQAIIPGIIEQWYISEGDVVGKGDTLLRLGEIKSEYLDTQLIMRLTEQLHVKEEAVIAYGSKIRSLLDQKQAIIETRDLKFPQLKNKLEQKQFKLISDSGKVVAAKANLEIAQIQFENTKKLFDQRLKSLTELQTKEQKLQEKQAKLITAQNQYEITQNDVLNVRIKLTSLSVEYREKLSKIDAYVFSAKSDLNEGKGMVSKLQNKLDGTKKRSEYLYITAPQEGYVTQALQLGLGQTVKAGTPILSIMPKKHQLATALYVDPVDLPLIGLNHQVRLIFDGWPTFVFSGWPDASYGTFAGEIVAIDNIISKNGKYRVLVSPIVDEDTNQDPEHPWPIQLRLGSGCKGIALLNDVPVWKEIWRQLNGFPQDFYDEYQEHPYEHHKKKKGGKDGKK